MHVSESDRISQKGQNSMYKPCRYIKSYLTIPSVHIIHVLHYLWHRLQSIISRVIISMPLAVVRLQ